MHSRGCCILVWTAAGARAPRREGEREGGSAVSTTTSRERIVDCQDLDLHQVFSGNPGGADTRDHSSVQRAGTGMDLHARLRWMHHIPEVFDFLKSSSPPVKGHTARAQLGNPLSRLTSIIHYIPLNMLSAMLLVCAIFRIYVAFRSYWACWACWASHPGGGGGSERTKILTSLMNICLGIPRKVSSL